MQQKQDQAMVRAPIFISVSDYITNHLNHYRISLAVEKSSPAHQRRS